MEIAGYTPDETSCPLAVRYADLHKDEPPAERELCHCGRPLHYTNPNTEFAMREMIRLLGPTLLVTVAGRSWKVPRHYLALHGLKGRDVASLGFEEVTDARGC
jgi:hypothetical protein